MRAKRRGKGGRDWLEILLEFAASCGEIWTRCEATTPGEPLQKVAATDLVLRRRGEWPLETTFTFGKRPGMAHSQERVPRINCSLEKKKRKRCFLNRRGELK